MISYIEGILSETAPDGIVVEAGGVGYFLRVPSSLPAELPPPGSRVKIYTHLQVREDGIALYGFRSRDEVDVFRLLLSVSGVGPKAALGVLSVLSADDLRFAVLSDDAKVIAKAPGLGPKTAKKVILELKDKFSMEEVLEKNTARETAASPSSGARDEAVLALEALGYSASEALRTVRGLPDIEGLDTEAVLKLALRELSGY